MAKLVRRNLVEHNLGRVFPRAFGEESMILTGSRMTPSSATSRLVAPMSCPEAEGRIASWIAARSFAALREKAFTPKLSRKSRFQSSIAGSSTASSFRSEIGDTYSGRGKRLRG